jgi:putative ABC transport system permease protein
LKMPDWKPEIFRRLAPLKLAPTREAEIAEELAQHLEDRYQELLTIGNDEDEARRQAIEELKGEDFLARSLKPLGKDSFREPVVPGKANRNFFAGIFQDVRYALRMLRKNPGFTAAAILAMAVGIGANTANFSMFDAIVWQAIPVPGFGRLALASELHTKTGNTMNVSAGDFLAWQGQARSFSGLAAFHYHQFDHTGNSPAEEVFAAAITPNFFRVLGAAPLFGRSFTPAEAEPGRNHVAILDYRYWESHFAGDSGVIHRTIELDHAAYTIIGVMPRDIDYPTVDLFVPLALSPAERADRNSHILTVLGRLKAGVSLKAAQAELSTISAQLAKTYPTTNRDLSADVVSLRVYVNGNLSYYWGIMFAAAMALVLLIACANVTNLQLARAATRRREMALRAALGASRGIIVRQLFVESLLMALLGACGGILVAEIGLHLLSVSLPPTVTRLISGWDRIRLSGPALVFTILIAVAAGIVSGLLPALQGSKTDLVETFKEGGHSSTPGRRSSWIEGALVVAQMSLALVLLVGTALLVRGFHRMVSQQEQFDPSSVLLFHVDLPAANYKQPADRLAFYQQVLQKLSATPGVHSVSLLTTFPLSNDGGVGSYFQVAGQSSDSSQEYPSALIQSVSPGFFSLLDIPILAGRDFNFADGTTGLRVAIINRKLAARYWPQESPIGKQLRLVRAGKPGPWLTIVGVVGDVQWDWTDQVPESAIFQPYAQAPQTGAFFALRDGKDPDSLVPTVRREMASLAPDLPLTGDMAREPEPLSRAIHDATAGLGVVAGLMSALGLVAFALAVIGVYGVMAYAVTQRTHEVAVRMALGASAASVFGLILRRSLCLLVVALAIGLPLSYALAHLLAGFIFGVHATDPVAFTGAIGTLVVASLLASYAPASRAMRVDPMVALRHE